MQWASVLPSSSPSLCKGSQTSGKEQGCRWMGWGREERPFSPYLCPQDLTLAGSPWVLGSVAWSLSILTLCLGLLNCLGTLGIHHVPLAKSLTF